MVAAAHRMEVRERAHKSRASASRYAKISLLMSDGSFSKGTIALGAWVADKASAIALDGKVGRLKLDERVLEDKIKSA